MPADGASADPAALDDIETAVRLHREAISIAQAGYPDQPGLRSNLGSALTLRAVLAGPGQPQQAGRDLAEAVNLHREAVRLAPATHPYTVRLHGNYCRALAEQAARTGDRALLDEAVTVARQAGERARPGEQASAARVLLVVCLAQRARDAADPASLRELIDALEDPASPPASPDEAAERRLAAADAWTEHYWVSGDPASLTRAIKHARAVLDEPGDTVYGDTVYQEAVYRDTARFTLSTVLRYRFEYVGDPADLAEATGLARAALAAAAADDPGHRASCLGHLGVCLVLAASPRDTGQLHPQGIGLIRQAISGVARPATRPRCPCGPTWPSRCAPATRKPTTWPTWTRRSSSAAPSPPHRCARPTRPGTGTTWPGWASRSRSGTGTPGRPPTWTPPSSTAVRASGSCQAGDPLRASYLSSLGLALQLRYGERGQAADLDEAVFAGDAAVAAIPDGDPYRWMALSNAGLAHRLRSELTGGEEDLQAAIELSRASVTAASPDQAALPGSRSNLSRALFVRWQRHRDAADLRDAVAGFRAVARLAGAPRQGRLQAAISWAACATAVADWPAAADAYETAVDLLELVVWHGLPRATREAQLARLPGLASQAAASALAAGDPARALAVLDRGRSVLWTQQLRLRSSFDEVRDAAPELHQQLVQLAEELGRDPAAGGPGGLAGLAPGPPTGRLGNTASSWLRPGTRRWARSVRGPGLAGTLRPPDAAELAGCAAGGPCC